MNCLCGCKNSIKEDNKYINGHNRRNKKPWNYDLTKEKDNRIKDSWNKNLTKEMDERIEKSSRKCSKTKKRLFKEGKIKVWNKDLTKENNIILQKVSKNVSETLKKKYRNKELISPMKDKEHTKKTRKKISKSLSGSKHPNWIENRSFLIYSDEFNKELKQNIRKRDDYRCQECFRHQSELYDKNGKKYSLCVHHIDYNKKNNNPDNLISLCFACHSQTNYKREDWINYFQNKTEAI